MNPVRRKFLASAVASTLVPYATFTAPRTAYAMPAVVIVPTLLAAGLALLGVAWQNSVQREIAEGNTVLSMLQAAHPTQPWLVWQQFMLWRTGGMAAVRPVIDVDGRRTDAAIIQGQLALSRNSDHGWSFLNNGEARVVGNAADKESAIPLPIDEGFRRMASSDIARVIDPVFREFSKEEEATGSEPPRFSDFGDAFQFVATRRYDGRLRDRRTRHFEVVQLRNLRVVDMQGRNPLVHVAI